MNALVLPKPESCGVVPPELFQEFRAIHNADLVRRPLPISRLAEQGIEYVFSGPTSERSALEAGLAVRDATNALLACAGLSLDIVQPGARLTLQSDEVPKASVQRLGVDTWHTDFMTDGLTTSDTIPTESLWGKIVANPRREGRMRIYDMLERSQHGSYELTDVTDKELQKHGLKLTPLKPTHLYRMGPSPRLIHRASINRNKFPVHRTFVRLSWTYQVSQKLPVAS
jgi:hypothetical protein